MELDNEKAENEKEDNQKAPAEPVEATEESMMAMFGIGDFSSTKNQNHTKDAEEANFKSFIQKREHRQFMNKRGPGILRQGPMQMTNDN